MAPDVPDWLGALIAFVFGASIGSFVNVVAYRLPREISIATPRSFCPACNRSIPWWTNIPILAYLGLRGRCIMCGAPIAFRHFLAEIALAVTAAYLYLHFPFLDALARFVFCAALFIVALIDYDWRLIPNIITFPGIPLGLIAAALVIPEVGLKRSLIGIAIGWGFLFLTGEVYFWLRGREGVGMGDVWLLGMVGAFMGWPGAIFTLFVGSIFGSVGGLLAAFTGGGPPPLDADASVPEEEADASVMQTTVPFGPFLSLAAGVFALFQPQIKRWYLGH
ncbi:MAG TPA: prepilin peptidase [Candidatus Binataceae bacterium]|nr:prepilin peptidase [Candidatus Binataceae bacterium]